MVMSLLQSERIRCPQYVGASPYAILGAPFRGIGYKKHITCELYVNLYFPLDTNKKFYRTAININGRLDWLRRLVYHRRTLIAYVYAFFAWWIARNILGV